MGKNLFLFHIPKDIFLFFSALIWSEIQMLMPPSLLLLIWLSRWDIPLGDHREKGRTFGPSLCPFPHPFTDRGLVEVCSFTCSQSSYSNNFFLVLVILLCVLIHTKLEMIMVSHSFLSLFFILFIDYSVLGYTMVNSSSLHPLN